MALNFTDRTAREAIESGKTVVIDFGPYGAALV